ncbi:hypothetical protein D030_0135B, partial [Vibrio parahaemolyticus AQ3810]|jgi:NADH dehydrogenase/NADH:ubiquinone oxidoreductase subunit G
LVM